MEPRHSSSGVGAVVLAGVVLLSSGCATYLVHPEFKTRQPALRAISVLPTDIGVYRVSFAGDKDLMHELVPQVNTDAQDAIVYTLTQKGYVVTRMDVSEETLAQKPEVRAAWHTVMELYEKALADIQKHRQSKFTYTLGPDVNVLADHAGADALILMKGEELKKTGGEIAREVLLGALFGTPFMPSETHLLLAVIDGNTGDLLWFHFNIDPRFDAANGAALKTIIERILAPFPKSSAKQLEEKERRERRRHPVSAPVETPSIDPGPSAAPPPNP